MEAEDHEDGGREWTCAAASQGMPRVDSYLPHPLKLEEAGRILPRVPRGDRPAHMHTLGPRIPELSKTISFKPLYLW